ncbi:MAG: aspartyl/asparaginyl beta-hydroxylase domain-containing protein [Rhodanobacteraceae bacterium]|nr:aspartyl/asparaginyl beta-hydroxylase domain-containing protein [Rhodanobacteraceae bacterium]
MPAHYGSVNGRLVVHLPLIVPPNCGALKVVDEARAWEYGRLLIFDDTFEHEHGIVAIRRAVLIFDVWNPYLSAAEREGFRRVLTTAQKFEQAAV